MAQVRLGTSKHSGVVMGAKCESHVEPGSVTGISHSGHGWT